MPFCRYCGRKLEEGEHCTCHEQAGKVSADLLNKTDMQGKQLIGAAWKDFTCLLKMPTTYGALYIQRENYIAALIFLVLHGICSGIFATLCIGKINGLISLGGSLTEKLKFSSVGAFFLTLLYSVILASILACLFLGIGKVMKGQITFQKALCIASLRSVISVPVILVSCLIFLLNIPAGIVVYYCAGTLLGASFLEAGAEGILGISKDRKFYLAILVIVLFVFLFLLFASMVWPNYIPASIRDAFSFDNIVNALS